MKLLFTILLTVSLFSSSFLFANKTKKSRLSINSNSMSFVDYKFLAKNKPVIKLDYKNINKVKFELFKIKDLTKLVKEKRYYNSHFSLKVYNDKNIKKTRIKKWTKWLKYKDEYQRDSFKLNKLKPGVYLLYAKANKNIESATIINISNNVLIVQRLKSKVLVYSSDAVTGKAIANAEVHIGINKLDNKTNKTKSSYKFGKTDKNGIFTIFDEDFIKNEDITLDLSITVIKANNNAFLYIYGATAYSNSYTYNKSFVYTDKKIYTKNEKVFYKLLLRSKKDNKYFIPNERFKLTVVNQKMKKVFEQEIVLNEIGSFSGSFSLEKFAQGPYLITILNSKEKRVAQNDRTFKVKEFEAPKDEKENKKSTKVYKPYQEKRENPNFIHHKKLKINSITLDKTTYYSNEKAKILIKIQDSNVYSLISIKTKDNLKYQLEYIKGNEKEIEINLDKTMLPTALVKVSYFKNSKYKEIEKYIIIKPIDKLLNIDFINKQKEYKINEKTKFKFKLSNFKGNPIKNAELNLIMVDADIYNLEGRSYHYFFDYFHRKFEYIQQGSHHSTFSPLFYKKYNNNYGSDNGVMGGLGSLLYDDGKKVISKPITKTYWITNIKTDENGEAVIEVNFPKDITKWKLMIKAVTKDTMIGEFEEIIETK